MNRRKPTGGRGGRLGDVDLWSAMSPQNDAANRSCSKLPVSGNPAAAVAASRRLQAAG